MTGELPPRARLLAVSKGHPAASIRAVASLGQQAFGESRLQEAVEKQALLSDLTLQWHFIGRLQRNKVRGVVKAFSVIHSVDSLALAERVSRIAVEEGCCPEVLLQVRFREDPTKGGDGAVRAAVGLAPVVCTAIDAAHGVDDHGSTRPGGRGASKLVC